MIATHSSLARQLWACWSHGPYQAQSMQAPQSPWLSHTSPPLELEADGPEPTAIDMDPDVEPLLPLVTPDAAEPLVAPPTPPVPAALEPSAAEPLPVVDPAPLGSPLAE